MLSDIRNNKSKKSIILKLGFIGLGVILFLSAVTIVVLLAVFYSSTYDKPYDVRVFRLFIHLEPSD